MQKATLAALALTVLAVAGCGGGGEQASLPLKFTAIPDQNTTELMERFQPMATYLSEALGVPVQYVPARDYQASVEMFRNGDVQLAWFGGLTGVQARRAVPGARAIAQGKADPEYFSYFIAHHSTGLEFSEDFPQAIKDLTFTFGSESSTSGRLMPEYFIRELGGAVPAEFFAQPYGFSGSHDKTLELVAAGRYQVGALSYTLYDKRLAAGEVDPEVVKVIWKTPFYADYNFTAHPDLDTRYGAGFIDRLQKVLVGIEDQQLLSALPRKALIPARDEEYAGIEDVARELGMVR